MQAHPNADVLCPLYAWLYCSFRVQCWLENTKSIQPYLFTFGCYVQSTKYIVFRTGPGGPSDPGRLFIWIHTGHGLSWNPNPANSKLSLSLSPSFSLITLKSALEGPPSQGNILLDTLNINIYAKQNPKKLIARCHCRWFIPQIAGL